MERHAFDEVAVAKITFSVYGEDSVMQLIARYLILT
jgi:hypothetical protein